jgi:1-aminocyclopropane-1-carboxylate deaminase
MLNYKETPVTQIFDGALEAAGVKVYVKREDFNHTEVSGNKWWKLKYNLVEAKRLGYKTLLTFGGAFSNHIYATAAASKELGFKSIGIIRGEEALPLNDTLAFAKSCGMMLHYVSREDYRNKSMPEFINQLKNRFGDFFLIPEGGTNQLALMGCAEFAKEKLQTIDFDYICLPVGTGGTIAGIIAGFEGKKKVIGFPVLKNGEFLSEEIKELLIDFSGKDFANWKLQTDYHFGGYAKHTKELDRFILEIKEKHDLPLEFVYTGKMVAAVYNLISKNYFERGSKILMVHTGGLRT